MDRRTLIFIFGMTLIFFFLHQWFYFGPATTKVAPIAAPKTQIEIIKKGQPTRLSSQEMSHFGIVPLYKDIQLKEPVFNAIKQKDNYLALSTSTDLPDVLYAKIDATVTQRINLRIAPQDNNQLALYSVYPLEKLELPWLTNEGIYNVYLLYFEGQDVFSIEGQAFGVDKLVLNQKPPVNAVILIDFKNQTIPYAFYDSASQSMQYLNALPQFNNYSILTYAEDVSAKKERKEQQYYVLENEFQQLVFTNLNGALVEINLPFHSQSNTQSVVRPIEFDKILAKNYPLYDKFPQFPYNAIGDKGESIVKQSQVGGYYPLLRRNLLGAFEETEINPHYYAFNVVALDQKQSSEVNVYKVKRFEKNLIEFELIENNRKITKTFFLSKNDREAPYCLNLDLKIEGDSRNLYLSTGVPEVELISGSFSPTLKYRAVRNQKSKIEQIKPPKQLVSLSHVNADWYCNGNGFFGIILDPLNKSTSGIEVNPISGQVVPSRITVIDAQYQKYPPDKYPGYSMNTPVSSKPGVIHYRIFAGPFDKKILQTVDQTFANAETGYNPDYVEAQSYHGWFAFVSQPFANFLFIIMQFFYKITHSWGISIILLTAVLRLILYPLNNWSMRSTAKMQKFSPQIQALQEKYKKDPKRAQLETMSFYKKNGVNPLGGCLPIIIQLPFLFGMLDLLKSSFDLRGAPFIPGWIDNLTAPDVLFSWQYPLPFIGNGFHFLPILLGMIMFFQQKYLSTATTGPALTDQQRQQRFMGNIMTVVFTVMFYHFPSGLNIYWISSMLFGILQQWWVNKQVQLKGK